MYQNNRKEPKYNTKTLLLIAHTKYKIVNESIENVKLIYK